ncbi:MAG: thioesterase domain-containing protein [Blastocatellia bacterium]
MEAALSSCVGVRQAAVIAEGEGVEGRLVAYVIGKEGEGAPTKEKLQEHMKKMLPGHMVPGVYVEIEEMPLLGNGKIDRKALSRNESSRQKTRAREKDFLDSTELQLIRVWEEVLCVQCIDITDNFFELGGNSLSAVSLCARLRKIYGAQISVRMVFDAPTIESMAVLVRQNTSPSPPSSVIPINPHGEQLPFFCMPAAGGIPHSYIPLAHGLGPDQPFYALQSYGLDLGQEPLSRVEDMAAVYIEDIQKVQPAGPYQIGGWSFGVPVSFEIAQQLTAMGEEVRLLVLMDSPRNCNPADRPLSEAELREAEQSFLAEYLQEGLGLAVESLTFDQQVLLYMNTQKESGMLPADITQEQIRRYIRVTVSNKHAARLYQPKPYSGRVTLFKSSFSRHEDYSYGWKELALGGIDVFNFDSSHADFVSKSNAPLVAESLRKCFETATLSEPCKNRKATS